MTPRPPEKNSQTKKQTKTKPKGQIGMQSLLEQVFRQNIEKDLFCKECKNRFLPDRVNQLESTCIKWIYLKEVQFSLYHLPI